MSATPASHDKPARALISDLITLRNEEHAARQALAIARTRREYAQAEVVAILQALPGKSIQAFGEAFWLDSQGRLRSQELVSADGLSLAADSGPVFAGADAAEFGPRA